MHNGTKKILPFDFDEDQQESLRPVYDMLAQHFGPEYHGNYMAEIKRLEGRVEELEAMLDVLK